MASNCTRFSYGHQSPCSGRDLGGGGLVLGGRVAPCSSQGTANKVLNINCKIYNKRLDNIPFR